MEAASAIENMRAKLEASFGKAVAMMILASASNVANCATIGLSPDDFCRLSDAVCKDQRVIDMWGLVAAMEAGDQWKRLVR